MSNYKRHGISLIEEAQQWERVLKDAGPDEQGAFTAWIKRSPQHLQAYLQHLAIQTELRRLDPNGELDMEALLAKASTNVINLTSGMPQTTPAVLSDSGRGRPWRLMGAVAASTVLAICLILTGVLSRSQWMDYTTDTGEQRRIVLPDGSSIELNTQSRIRVSFQPASREVDLLTGEALFNVQHDATRPFRVRVAGKVVEDLGTQFSIYLRPDASTTVSVLDGRVQISSARSERQPDAAVSTESTSDSGKSELISKSTQLSAGEQIHIAVDGRLSKRTAISVADAAPWREHRLWFEGVPLPEVAAEFNRYNKRQLHISNDAALLNRRYTATFDAYDPDSFVQALQDDPSLMVQSNEQEVLIQAR